MNFLEELKQQRWDDHRYYHHSRINQTLHLISAMSFLAAYSLLFVNPVMAAFLGWIVAMVTRQIGHFFFEPKGYDEVNQATHEHKEEIKVGYNLRRKIVLLTFWFMSPLALYYSPTFFGIFQPYVTLPFVFEKDQSVEYPVTYFAASGSPTFFLSNTFCKIILYVFVKYLLIIDKELVLFFIFLMIFISCHSSH